MARRLEVNPERCDGCRKCETACSVRYRGMGNPVLSSIRVIQWEDRGFYLPVCCRHCQDAPCMAVCPREAIYRDETLDRVMIDYDRCISCKMCVAACPFGAMQFDDPRGRVFKCDLCNGDPQCVPVCDPKAIAYEEADKIEMKRMRAAAERYVFPMPRKAA
jgi:Fe-S-cluster-containing hydrogenase component 2